MYLASIATLLLPLFSQAATSPDISKVNPQTAIVVATALTLKAPPQPLDMRANYQAMVAQKALEAQQALLAAQAAQLAAEQAQAAQIASQQQMQAAVILAPSSDVAGWEAVAKCESHDNWADNTGNGYYGGLQFDIGTWGNFGGYANASLAPESVQIQKADQIKAARGLSPWPICGANY